MKNTPDSKGKIWLSQNILKYRPWIIMLTALTVLATACSVGFAYLSSYLIDSAIEKSSQRLVLFACIVLILLVSRIVLRAFINYYTEKCRATIVTDLRSKTFKKVLKSDYAKIKDYHSGELVTRITADTSEVAGSTVNLLPQAIGIIIQLLGAIIALFALDGLFTLFLVIGGIVIVGISAFLRKKTKWYYKEIVSADGASRSFMQESIVSSLTVKAFTAEDKTSKKADGILSVYKKRRLGRAKLTSLMGVLYSVVTNLGLVFAIIWCSFGIMNGMAYGSVLSIVLLMEQLQRPLNTVSAIMPAYYSRQASAERLCEIDCLEEEKIEQSVAQYGKIKAINFENVEFSYDEDLVLNDLSFSFKTGEVSCVYGASGIGKSTLFKMLLGAYKPQKGRVYLDCDDGAVEIGASQRGLFAYVPQGNFLFTGTIYENLTFFANEQDTDVLEDKVKRAIALSCAEFVYELPNSLNTVLSEQGGGLSEGQRQRLAIARAFISDRPILLFDEATSALDDETEQRLIDNIKKMKDKTVIIISHRQAVINSADKLIRL